MGFTAASESDASFSFQPCTPGILLCSGWPAQRHLLGPWPDLDLPLALENVVQSLSADHANTRFTCV